MRAAAAGVAALSILAACSSDNVTSPTQDDAKRAVDVFTQLADSIVRAGGDADEGSVYASLAEAVRQGGRISPIVITVDGVPTSFLATAHHTDIDQAPCSAQQICAAVYRHSIMRTLIAWQRNDPRRVVQLSSHADTDPIRAYINPVLVPYPGNSASLTFFDGKGGFYFGTSGSQAFTVTTSETPCTSAGAGQPIIAIFPAPARCTQADFVINFDGKAEPSSFLVSRNNATGTHSLSMAAQPVLGAAFSLSGYLPPLPPINVTPGASLPATLTAKVDSVVTLTLTVSNPTSAPLPVSFSSAKRFDFTIMEASTGKVLWSWGMDKLFAAVIGTETIPANGTLVYTAQWKATTKGSLIAIGQLESLSHRAAAKVAIMLP